MRQVYSVLEPKPSSVWYSAGIGSAENGHVGYLTGLFWSFRSVAQRLEKKSETHSNTD
jgi:hypothetical protein